MSHDTFISAVGAQIEVEAAHLYARSRSQGKRDTQENHQETRRMVRR